MIDVLILNFLLIMALLTLDGKTLRTALVILGGAFFVTFVIKVIDLLIGG